MTNEKTLAETSAFLVRQAQEIKVVDQETERQALTFLGNIRTEVKRLDGERKEKVKPLKEETDRINDGYKTLIDPLKTAEAKLTQACSVYRTAEAKRLEKLEADRLAAIRLQAEAAPPQAQEAKELLLETKAAVIEQEKAVPTTVSTGQKIASFTTKLEITVTEPDLVPREFCSPDTVKLRAAANSGRREIPGVHIEETKKPVFR